MIEVELTLTELREVFLNFKAAADSGVVPHIPGMKMQQRARAAKTQILSFGLTEVEKFEDFLDDAASTRPTMERYSQEAFAEANEDPGKHDYLFQMKMALDPNLTQRKTREMDIWKSKTKFSRPVVFVDEDLIKANQEIINRNTKGYKFDLTLAFPASIKVDFRGTKFDVSPYTAYCDLVLDGFIVTDEKEYEAIKKASEAKSKKSDTLKIVK